MIYIIIIFQTLTTLIDMCSRAAESKLYVDVGMECIPIVYRDEYNIRLLGMEKLHPFDAGKWGNVVKVC